MNRFLSNESGATAIEYGMIVAIVGVGMLVSFQKITASVTSLLSKVKTTIDNISI